MSSVRSRVTYQRFPAWATVKGGLALLAIGLLGASIGVEAGSWKKYSDGWERLLEGMTFETSHHYPSGNQLLQSVYESSQGYRTMGGEPSDPSMGGDGQRRSLCFWMRLRVPPGAMDNIVEVLADEAGYESMAFQGGIGMSLPDSTLLYTHVAYVWPSSRKIALRCYLHDKAGDLVPVAEFAVENPAYGTPHTTLTPDASPASGKNGNLVVTFEGYGYGPLPPRPHWHRRATTRPLPFLRLRTWEGGKPSSGWQVRRITLSDGALNDFSYDTLSYRDGNQEIVPLTWTTSEAAEMPCVLWPGSPAWKIQLVMGIRTGIELPPEEVCQVNRIAIHRRGASAFTLLESRAWNKFNVSITSESDVGIYTNWLRDANGVLRISLGEHLPQSMLAVVDARDDRGIPVTNGGAALPDSYGYHGERMDTSWHVPIYLPDNAQHLSLSLGVCTNRVVEFVAPAPDFPPAKPFVIREAKPTGSTLAQ